ncbi:MAG: DUF362 domain-containing protein [Candidatus Heimdallarchaeota archaeon]|nr:DUF362 domain-containing protein [Candidatus Heimdallarchaeota archaeon]
MNESELIYVKFKDNVKFGFSNIDLILSLFEESVGQYIKPGERILLKTHFGQWGNLAYFRPSILRALVDAVKAKGAFPSIGETCGLGYGSSSAYSGRNTASDYYSMAAKHGYTIGTMGAPIIMLDGELGADTFKVDIEGEYVKRVEVGRGALHFHKIIMVTHSKGHPSGGYGGALKNLGIGMVGKYGKAMMHRGEGIDVLVDKCKGEECSECIRVCPQRCISFVDDKATIDKDECILCGHCNSVCANLAGAKAIKMNWITDLNEQSKRFAENASGVIKGLGADRFYYLNFIIDVSLMCDCMPYTPYLLSSDLGIVAGRDPVAIDQASMDLINQAPVLPNTPISQLKAGDDKFAHGHAKEKDGEIILASNHKAQIEQAAKMGIGTTKYILKELDLSK